MPNPHPAPQAHSKGGIAERYFHINRLNPPVVHDVPLADLPMHLSLGAYKLALDPASGSWNLADGMTQNLQNQIATLQAQLELAEREKLTYSAQAAQAEYTESMVLQMERKQIEIEKANLQLLHENNQLKFKNKVLSAMAAIAEGDYRALCAEAGVDIETRQSSSSQFSPMKQQPNMQRMQSSPESIQRIQSTTSNQSFNQSFNQSMNRTPDSARYQSYAPMETKRMSEYDNHATVKAPLRYQLQA